jgi:hypothetical protein
VKIGYKARFLRCQFVRSFPDRNIQLQATATNILNRQYRGAGGTSIDPFIDDRLTIGNTTTIDPVANTFLNSHGQVSNNRTVTLGAKFIF